MGDTLAMLTGLLSVVLGLGVIAAALGGAYLLGKERGRKEAAELLKRGASDELNARTERAIEALALEVERIGEGQRHAAKMLAEAASKDALPR